MKLRTQIPVVALGVAALFTLFGTTVAHASYSGDGGVDVTPTSPSAGGSAMITSTGWKADSAVTITLHSTPVVLATATADASGAVSQSVTIPSSTSSGSHTVQLTGTDPSGAPRDVSTPITVSSSGGGGSLPRTGAAIAALVLVGLVLFGVGSLLSAARKRAVR